jgi:hypothetical protein
MGALSSIRERRISLSYSRESSLGAGVVTPGYVQSTENFEEGTIINSPCYARCNATVPFTNRNGEEPWQMTAKWLFSRAISYDTSTRNSHPALVHVHPRYAGNFSCSLSDDSQGTRSRVELVGSNCAYGLTAFFPGTMMPMMSWTSWAPLSHLPSCSIT